MGKQKDEFLTAEQEQSLIEAIGVAEKNTSGEIRIHIEKKTDLLDVELYVQLQSDPASGL